ncbi:MAG TPA: F0F1 ATP synthase subunit epsilon [Flavobacteriaceae bacterium]|nr:F0F1 ATP synthase subunit epsilon [Flavobacteriaceae bacterium]
MQLEIVSPERVLLKGEVESVTVPGIDGKFQMLNNHAPVVSVLEEGYISLKLIGEIAEEYKDNFFQGTDGEISIEITGGVLEMNNNKAIVLVD